MGKFEQAGEIGKRRKFIKTNFLAFPGDGFSYIRYRVLRPLLKLFTHWQRGKFKPHPWLTPAAINIFDAILNKEMTGLEYGSGSSTLFFASRLGQLESIEHNKDWYEKVINMLGSARVQNVNLHLIPENKADKTETDLGIQGFEPRKSYTNYFGKVREYPDHHFDFILIDGRARVECTVYAIPKLKSGGILALDNSERRRYTPVFDLLSDWQMVNTTNGLTNTTIWFKP